MVEEAPRDRDRFADEIDRLLKRIDPRRSLPGAGSSGTPALGPPTAVMDEGGDVREPPADVLLTPTRIYVTFELPGASHETLEVTATNLKLVVHARGANGRLYHKEMDLPKPVDSDPVTATYRNGVLDVVLRRTRAHRVRVRKVNDNG